ncbi:hypothetical protein TURU_091664 [Turdus rufiventris]|nr:hypothetical protein TURU_091664 [Turdus rufiventris]
MAAAHLAALRGALLALQPARGAERKAKAKAEKVNDLPRDFASICCSDEVELGVALSGIPTVPETDMV